MQIIETVRRPSVEQNEKLTKKYSQFEMLLDELRKRELPADITRSINNEVEQLNAFSGSDKELLKKLNQSQTSILKLVEKELKLVPKKHYQNMWMAVGMAAFGIPFGVMFGVSLGNMGFLGIGLPIGLAIGVAIGTSMDKKALESGNQLDIEIKP
ncbi:hypothetical protein ACSX1A_00315 [Pontibacter sp. MBLB2868]|uniref:hypothetical protein n=1 Tax=Pontibacter sp. MBLB2868 TaxID=3451555 RepID=UPI003F756DBB